MTYLFADQSPFDYIRVPPIGAYFANGPAHTVLNSASTIDGRVHWSCFDNPSPWTVDEVTIEVVTTAGDLGALARPMFYLDRGDLIFPGPLLHDCGTVAVDVVGMRPIATTFTLPAGRIWFGAPNQGAVVTRPTLRACFALRTQQLTYPVGVVPNFVGGSPATNGVTGAPPATATGPHTSTNIFPVVRLHRSA